jgi:predicted lysophospholipase L1 biosynthesis ABC-type transport system permease subunit
MSQLVFYLQYAARNLRRNLRWTAFAVFVIAAGVATIVALRSLGLAIGDSLVGNARASNRGDITLTADGGIGNFGDFGGAGEQDDNLSPRAIERIEQTTRDLGGNFTAYSVLGNFQVTAVDTVSVGRPQFVTMLLIDPETYPPMGDILAQEPAGTPLRDLLGRNSIVISRNLADQQNLAVGDTVRLSGTTDVFTVMGIVATEQEAGLRNLFASFFGFAYVHRELSEQLGVSTQPNALSVTLPDGVTDEQIQTIGNDFQRLAPGANVDTVVDVLRQNAVVADVIGRFVVVMGLGALLIGGVGIINTMLVMVSRRTMEIAALKTFGLKGGQVGALFLAEAFWLGILGSILGCIIGVLLSGAVNAYGETFLQQRLPWRIYPEALLYGAGLGMVVTMVFGLLPVLTANRIRPASILRPNEAQMPPTSIFHSLLVLLLVVVIVGGIAGQILGNIWVGMIGVAITLLLMGLIVGQLWLIVWAIGKLPSFGNVDIKLALRNMTARRIRTATTLMALSAGMFALSSIAFVGAGTREILNFQLTRELGGNVIVLPIASFLSQGIGSGLLNAQLNQIDGITYRTEILTYNAQVVAVNGERPQFDLGLPEFLMDNIPEEAQQDIQQELREISIQVQVRDTDNPNPVGTIIAGRNLTAEDNGRPVLVMPDSQIARGLGLTVGSIITLEEDRIRQDFEIVGIAQESQFGFSSGAFTAPGGAFEARPDFSFFILQVAPENLNPVLLELTENPLNLAFDLTFIDGLISRFITQFSTIPTIVGVLSLLAAAVTMANTVSLATLERRRQFGVLKAVGLKTDRVLGVMLIENTLIGLLGGVLGIGLSALGVAAMTALSTDVAIPIPADAMPIAVALIAAAIIIAWVSTLLSGLAAAREPVTSVLRYE